jgi:hypothetical protein
MSTPAISPAVLAGVVPAAQVIYDPAKISYKESYGEYLKRVGPTK